MSTKVKQQDITDCGAACLASIAIHYKLNVPIAHIRQLAGIDKRRATINKLVEAAQKMGFEANGVYSPFEGLFNVPIPAIAHVIVGEMLQHYVVIYKVTGKAIQIMNPINGQMHYRTHEEFKKEWTGIVVLMQPAGVPKYANEEDHVPASSQNLITPP